MTTSDLARAQNGELARPEDVGGYKPMKPLDVYANGLADDAPRVDWIATISCGRLIQNPKKPDEMIPRAARKSDPQWIYIHDQNDMAPGLTQALQEGNGRRLTIAFPWDDPSLFIQQSFRTYSHGSLLAYGDEKSMTVIKVTGSGRDERAEHITYMAGSKEYEELVRDSKANFSVFFALARWGENGPQVIFPDGAGMYRLRFTSRHTIRNILATIDETARMTHDRIAGIPFDLFVDFRQVAGPNGRKRDIPVFSIRLRPPFVLTSDTWRSTATAGLKAGSMLQLPQPQRETWETAVIDGPAPDDAVSDEDIDRLERGGRCDRRHWIKLWHALVRDTSLASKEARAEFLDEHTGQRFDSLRLFLDQATEDDASALIVSAQDYLIAGGELALSGDEEDDDADTNMRATHTRLPDDEYERLYGEGQVIDTEAREVAPPDADGFASHERLEAMKASLDEVINEPVPEQAEAQPPSTEMTVRQKMEAAYTRLHVESLTLDLAMPKLNPEWTDEDLESTGAHWKEEIKKARVSRRKEASPIGV